MKTKISDKKKSNIENSEMESSVINIETKRSENGFGKVKNETNFKIEKNETNFEMENSDEKNNCLNVDCKNEEKSYAGKKIKSSQIRNKYIFLLLFVIGLVGIDIISKVIFESQSYAVIPNFFFIQSTHNYGAGLGILSGKTALLIVLSILFLLAFIAFDLFYKRCRKVYVLSVAFIFAGAIGNLIDRIFLGYVRDFLYVNIKIMPYYFNFADLILTVGIVLFLIDNIFLSNAQSSIKIGAKNVLKENKDFALKDRKANENLVCENENKNKVENENKDANENKEVDKNKDVDKKNGNKNKDESKD